MRITLVLSAALLLVAPGCGDKDADDTAASGDGGDGGADGGDGGGDGGDGGADPCWTTAQVQGVGWSFGECVGVCWGELTLGSQGDAQYLSGGWSGGDVFSNNGTLTDAGKEQACVIAHALDSESLDATYGCPDCLDGGEAHMSIERGGSVSNHAWEYSSPPAVLSGLHDWSAELWDALSTCTDNQWIAVAEGCTVVE